MNNERTPRQVAERLKVGSPASIGRAMVALFDRQTRDEKDASDTRHNNQRGFSCAHVSKGSYYARWVLSGRELSGWHLENARKIALRYTRQLAEVANAKKDAS